MLYSAEYSRTHQTLNWRVDLIFHKISKHALYIRNTMTLVHVTYKGEQVSQALAVENKCKIYSFD